MFESKSFRFKQAFGKVMLHTRMKRKYNMMIVASCLTLFVADIILTYGIVAGKGWGCYRAKKGSNDTACDMDLGFRWKDPTDKTTGISIAQWLAALGLIFSFVSCLLLILTALLPSIGLMRIVLLIRLISSIVACYFVIVAIVMYVGSYSRLKTTKEIGYPNLVDDYGSSFYVTFIGWLFLALSVTFDGMGLVIPNGFESSTDVFLRRWLEKHYIFQRKKYLQLNDRDMPEMDVQQLAQAQ